MPNTRPTKESIDQAVGHLDTIWGDAVARWRTYDSFYHRRFALWPKGVTRETYYPSTPTNVIDHAADTQLAFEPRFHREPVGRGKKAEEEANDIEVAMAAIFDDMALHEPSLPWKQTGRYLLMYGYAAKEGPMWDVMSEPKRLPAEQGETQEEKDAREAIYLSEVENWNPIRSRAIHPARVLLDPTEKVPQLAIKREVMYKQRLSELAAFKVKHRKHAQRYEWDGKEPYAQQPITHHWNPMWHSVKQDDGDILWSERNMWGFVPYSHVFAGFGMEETESSRANPTDLAVGLLDPILESLKVQAQSRSARHRMLIEAAYAPLGSRFDPEEAAEALQNEILQGEQDDYWKLKVQEIPRWMDAVDREVDQDIQQGSYTRQLAGNREPGVVTLGQQAILSNAAARKFNGPAVQLAHMATLEAQRILRLVDVFGKTIGAKGHHITPEMVRHNYNIQVSFEVLDPVIDLQRREIGMQEYDRGLIDDATYRHIYGRYADETAIRKKLLQQEVMRDPLLAGELAIEAVAEIGLEAEARRALEARKAAAQEGAAPVARSNGATPPGTPADLFLPDGLTNADAKPRRPDTV